MQAKRDYNKVWHHFWQHINLRRLSAKKDLNVDEEKKKQVKDLRDERKRYMQRTFDEHYFSQTEEHILELH